LLRILPRLCYGTVTVLVFMLDQAIKRYILCQPVGVSLFRLHGIVEITHQLNTGAAFSLFAGHTPLILLMTGVLLPVIIYLLLTQIKLSFSGKIALSLLIGGSLGNLSDRLIYGGVIDYIRLLLIPFPVFNLADICIVLSVGMLAACLFTTQDSCCQE